MPTKAQKKYLKIKQKRQDEYLEKKRKSYQVKNMKEYLVNREIELLEFLYKTFPNESRNNVKMLLSKRHVAVNGLGITQFNYVLYRGDIVQITKEQLEKVEVIKSQRKEIRTKLDIIYEDNDFIVINKPSGVLTVESDKEKYDTAYKQVLEYMAKKDPQKRCFQVHRIDKETSGILLFTKSNELKEALSKNWNTLVKERGYVAIVEGQMPKKEDTITSYLKESSTHLMRVTDDEKDGIKAITTYSVRRETAKYSLLYVTLKTGRKNQIRVVLNSLGHPVVGDDKYGNPQNPLKRLGLHAHILTIKHPITKEILSFKAPIPASFKKIFK